MSCSQQLLLTSQLLLAFRVSLGLAGSVTEGATKLATVVTHEASTSKLQEHASRLQEMHASLSKVDSLRNAEWKGTLANNIEKLMAKLDKLDKQSQTVDLQITNAKSSRDELRTKIQILSANIATMTKDAEKHGLKMRFARMVIDDISQKYAILALAAQDAVGLYGSTCQAGAPIDLELQTKMVKEIQGDS
mmetsp:Transcript_8745/g.16584  ORF Transcript_8745/g.16584 Transcript_8745/m.16584 type:complete len:191 (-) Transcript_8745:67-639(-)